MPLHKRNAARRSGARRNAKASPKRRYRNAAPAAAPTRLTAPRAAAPAAQIKTPLGAKLLEWGESLAGSAAVTVIGSQLVKWGLPPMAVSIGAGGLGAGFALVPNNNHVRQFGNGASGAAASQLMLLALNPAPAPAPPPLPAPAPAPKLPTPQPAPPQAPARLKNADVGTLPPGMLDAAFERARAELAVQSDGLGHEPLPRFHHGPVMP